MKYELWEDTVIYTDGKIGAILNHEFGIWYPFKFIIENGNKIAEHFGQDSFATTDEAIEEAHKIYG